MPDGYINKDRQIERQIDRQIDRLIDRQIDKFGHQTNEHFDENNENLIPQREL